MEKSIFEYKGYKPYLCDVLDQRSRGERSRLAESIRCHSGYITQVLNGAAHFSLEQAELVNQFLAHSKDQSRFFLLLVQHDRAGTASLKEHFAEQMKELTEKQFMLKNRLHFKRSLSREDQAIFYSSWHYGSIHVLVSVPGCSTVKGISDYLGIPIEKTSEVIEFLVSVGLIVQVGDRYNIGTTHIHLENDSPMISKHHTNWRLQAIQSLDQKRPEDLHYSSVVTASYEDSPKIREILVKAIEQVRAVVRPSKNETAFSYGIDFFELRKK
jgi:uncharacterized protein (TIGR02147 family)